MNIDYGQQPHRILYAQPTSGGGSDHSLYELVRGLDKGRYQPIVMFTWPSPYQKLFEEAGVKVIVLSERLSPDLLNRAISRKKRNKLTRLINGPRKIYQFIRQDLRLASYVAGILKDEGIHLVHHNLSLASARPMVVAARMAGVPQVCHFRMFSEIPFIAKKLARFVYAFIYNSQAIAEHYTHLGIPSSKGHVIYNAIDIDAFTQVDDQSITEIRAELGLCDKDRLVSNIGRLESWKGQDYFIQAMAEVLKDSPNTKALLVGDSSPNEAGVRYREYLEKLAADLGILEQIIFSGYRSDIPQIMAASDIVVHSASEPEPFGRVIVEAMLAGRPVIATAAGGVLEIIEDQITGILVPLRDASSIAASILRLLQNPEEARKLGERALEDARLRFSVQQHVAAIEQVYQATLGSVK